jgi:hypothetical protein
LAAPLALSGVWAIRVLHLAQSLRHQLALSSAVCGVVLAVPVLQGVRALRLLVSRKARSVHHGLDGRGILRRDGSGAVVRLRWTRCLAWDGRTANNGNASVMLVDRRGVGHSFELPAEDRAPIIYAVTERLPRYDPAIHPPVVEKRTPTPSLRFPLLALAGTLLVAGYVLREPLLVWLEPLRQTPWMALALTVLVIMVTVFAAMAVVSQRPRMNEQRPCRFG